MRSMKLVDVIIGLVLVTDLAEGVSFFEMFTEYGWRSNYQVRTKPKPSRKEYDFIVVGAGPGGSTVTSRLSEDPDRNVLLLEAGEPDGLVIQIPFALAAFLSSEYNWGYRLEADGKSCLGMKDQRCTWPRGKSLGGTTTLYGMLHTRGNKLDFDRWAEMGNDGWDFENVLEYYKKSEKFLIPSLLDPAYHNPDGNVNVEYTPWRTPLSDAFLEAGVQLGYNVTDFNGANQIGFGHVQVHMDHGTRCTAAKAYLRVDRPNLDIVTSARVLKVLIDPEGGRAYGVEYEKDGKRYQVNATKEVILSAGSIDSAKLLMLSGIGPKEHLEELGIPVFKDAKVGYNLQEHVGFWGLTFSVNLPETLLFKRLFNPFIYFDYLAKREGLLAAPAGIEAIAYVQSRNATDARPDLELLFFSSGLHSDKGYLLRRGYGISDEVYEAAFAPLEGTDTVSIWPIVQQPKSRGRITLKSNDPLDNPILRGNFFDDPADVELFLEGVKIAKNLMGSDPFRKYGAKLNPLKIPGCEKFEFDTDDYWRCGLMTIPGMENHESGTIKMGPDSDPDAVVDPQLRVRGVKGLRVVDASIMPEIPVGHISATVYMIGEKGADMIKQAWP